MPLCRGCGERCGHGGGKEGPPPIGCKALRSKRLFADMISVLLSPGSESGRDLLHPRQVTLEASEEQHLTTQHLVHVCEMLGDRYRSSVSLQTVLFSLRLWPSVRPDDVRARGKTVWVSQKCPRWGLWDNQLNSAATSESAVPGCKV
jgi:hypothetical protein